MGIVSAVAGIGGLAASIYQGNKAASAARKAAGAQAQSGRESIAFQKESRDLAREDLRPFKEVGQEALPGLSGMVQDPNKQLEFVQDNPFFEALAGKATDTLLANQAAKGKVGSGGTAEALQNSLLLLGTDLVNQNIGQRQNLANLGLGAATGQAGIAQQTGQSVGQTIQGIGNAQAAGIVGGSNAQQQALQGGLSFLGTMIQPPQQGGGGSGGTSSLLACDVRFKENIKRVGQADNGLPLYMFNYKGDSTPHINVMAQDVEKVKPEAVVEINNYKFVNTDKLWQ